MYLGGTSARACLARGGPRRVPAQARFRRHPGAGRGRAPKAPTARPRSWSTSTTPAGCTTTCGWRWTARSPAGRCPRAPATTRRQAAGGADRGPPARVRRLRGAIPERRVRRRRVDDLGPGHLRRGSRRRRDGGLTVAFAAARAWSGVGRWSWSRLGGDAKNWLLIRKRDDGTAHGAAPAAPARTAPAHARGARRRAAGGARDGASRCAGRASARSSAWSAATRRSGTPAGRTSPIASPVSSGSCGWRCGRPIACRRRGLRPGRARPAAARAGRAGRAPRLPRRRPAGARRPAAAGAAAGGAPWSGRARSWRPGAPASGCRSPSTTDRRCWTRPASRACGGVIAKREDAPYRAGERSRDWLEVAAGEPARDRSRVLIAGFTRGRGRRERLGALVLAERRDGELVWAGNCGAGLGEAEIERLRRLLRPLERKTAPFAVAPRMPRVRAEDVTLGPAGARVRGRARRPQPGGPPPRGVLRGARRGVSRQRGARRRPPCPAARRLVRRGGEVVGEVLALVATGRAGAGRGPGRRRESIAIRPSMNPPRPAPSPGSPPTGRSSARGRPRPDRRPGQRAQPHASCSQSGVEGGLRRAAEVAQRRASRPAPPPSGRRSRSSRPSARPAAPAWRPATRSRGPTPPPPRARRSRRRRRPASPARRRRRAGGPPAG